jgi:serine/threonine protein kinase
VKIASQQSLGRYQIEAEIGRGAMGVVYRALDPKIDRIVAIKTISLAGQEPAAEQEYRERFLQEARAAGRLSHPGIVTIFDSAEDPETHEPYIVMEYIAGEPLSKIMSGPSRKLPLTAALQFAQEIAEALDYAHSQGVVHRDIKPANILVTADGHPKIADFGVARLNQELITPAGQIVGSPAYMAPEQMSGGQADARSDLFSLGVILYSMITGFRPFQGNSAQTVCFKVLNVEPVPVTSFQHDVPAGLDALISRAMAKDPKERYQSGAEMARDIQAFRSTDTSLADATAFFARAVQTDLSPAQLSSNRRRAGHDQGFSWQFSAAILALIGAASVFGWWESRSWHTPPAAQVQSAAALVVQQTKAETVAPPAKPRVRKVSLARKSAVVPPSTLAEPPAARMQIEFEHHFAEAKASVWVDGRMVFDQSLHGGDQHHGLFRTVVLNQVSSFQLASGRHLLQVRVVSTGGIYDQTEVIDAELSPGSEHVLRVTCDNRRKMQVAFQ